MLRDIFVFASETLRIRFRYWLITLSMLSSVNVSSAAVRAAYNAAQEDKTPWNTMPVSKEMYSEAAIGLEGAPVGTTYKGYESPIAVEGISEESLRSMPTPFDEEQAKRLSEGKPYKTGYWKGGSKVQWDALSAADKQTIMAGDLWVAGTTFVPTKQWQS